MTSFALPRVRSSRLNTASAVCWALALVFGLVAMPAYGAGGAPGLGGRQPEPSAVAQDVDRLRHDSRALRVELAQAQQLPQNYAAQVEVRLLELERRLQALTGQIEELQHQTRQVNDRLDRAIADMEFRLGQLEGGEGAAAPAPVGPASREPAAGTGTTDSGTPSAPQPGRRPGSTPDGGSIDPQVQEDGTGRLGTLTFRTPPESPDTLGPPGGGPTRLGPESPTGPTAALSGGNPAEDYQAAYRLLQRGDYAAAETALQDFLVAHGDHALASNALYWLGETYYVRGRYEDAAAAFASGYQRFPEGAKAVDNLLKLGMSLARLDRRDDACVALTRIDTEFPDGPIAIQRRAESEAERLGCR